MRVLMCLTLAAVAAAIPARAADVAFELETARLALDERGGVAGLTFADGAVWPGSGQAAFVLETDAGPAPSRQVALDGDLLRVDFENGARAEFRVSRHRSFVLFRLSRLVSDRPVRRFRLFALPVPPDATQIPTLGAAQLAGHFAAVMVAEPNVQTVQSRVGITRGDRAGCRHEFVQQSGQEAKQGRHAARFTATCDATAGGWSVRGRSFARPLDLSGCRAIRAWVHGDGQGQALKIQLADGRGGHRDDYVTIDFTGWRQVTLSKPALNTLRYDHVTTLNFYYNGLPASKTVTCLLDGVEALVMRQGREEPVLLEDFESPQSPLWASAANLLQVQTLAAHGIEPAAFAVLACPRGEAMDAIRRFEEAAGLPSPRLGGQWNKTSPWISRSYLFLTRFKESQFDEALAIARRGGFHAILLGQESWCRATGHYEINRASFPDGLDGLKRTVKRFQDAGFRVGFHFLGPSIYPPDPYLTPVPDPRLVKGVTAELAAAVDPAAGFLPLAAAPTAFPDEDGGYNGKGTILQIGDELIRYGQLSSDPPGFADCQRGHLGTKPAAHAKGAKVSHLLRSYGYHMFDMDTTLLDEVAANFARVANACGIDMVYFDGSERLQGDHWHYNAKLHKAFYDKLDNKDMLLQASSYSPYSWHILARSASADGHGDLKGYLDERSPWFDSPSRGEMPLDIGWYYGYDPSATPDMYEYVLGATIGYGSSMSYQVSVDAFRAHPFAGQILDLIARYEKLRLSGRVDEPMRQRLRIDPALGGAMPPEQRAGRLDRRREYRLVGPEKQEAFQRVIYGDWKEIDSPDPAARDWRITAPVAGRLGVELHARGGPWLAPGPSYNSPDAVVLETFDDLAPYGRDPKRRDVTSLAPGEAGSTLTGVRQRVERIDAGAPGAGRAAIYTAESALPGDNGWSVIARHFDPPLDLARHRGLGFWLRGDGQGGAFKLQLGDGKGAADHYIRNDYTGWRYHQLPRPTRDPINYAQVRTLMFYYNGLPARSTVSCAIDDVKALPALDERELADPWIEVGGRRFAWKGRLGAGQYLLFWPGEPARRHAPQSLEPELAGIVPSGELAAGEHPIRFGAASGLPMHVRVRTTIQPPERHLVR